LTTLCFFKYLSTDSRSCNVLHISSTFLPKCVNFPLTKRLFADDFSISLISSNPDRATRILHMTLDKITKWSSDRGYRFSDQKTVKVIFRKRSTRPIPIPSLHLQNFKIIIKFCTKFLGLTFDNNTTWTPHIKILRAKCHNALNILKYLSHPRTGVSRELLLQLHNSLTRFQLDYGAPIYSHSNKSSLKLLNTI